MSVHDMTALSNPVWHSLHGPHRDFALAGESPLAYRYRPDVAPFGALQDLTDGDAWNALARVASPSDTVVIVGESVTPPQAWRRVTELVGLQMVAPPAVEEPPSEDLVELTAVDVSEMLDLVELTKPGPFGTGTVELGGYLGVRRGGQLVAMAGRRLHPTGWSEISAVCTHPAHRGQGLSRRLVSAVAAGIQREGDGALLHVVGTNTAAIALYDSMGFTRRSEITFAILNPPAG